MGNIQYIDRLFRQQHLQAISHLTRTTKTHTLPTFHNVHLFPPPHHRLKAESIFASALIWPFCTFFGVSSSPPTPPKSVVLVAASLTGAGLSLIVSSFDFLVRGFRWGGCPNISPTGLGWSCRGSWSSSHGTPFMILIFLGTCAAACPPFLQLPLLTLVAVVDTLLALELLYRVNADVLVLALLIELRQLLLWTLPGGEWPLTLPFPLTLIEGVAVENAVLNVDEPGLRPRAHVPASSAGLRCLVRGVCAPLPFTLALELTLLCEMYGEVLRLTFGFGAGWESPMIRVVTLLAVPVVGVSSVGVDTIVLPLPKPNFHLLGFFTTTGLGASASTGACLATLEAWLAFMPKSTIPSDERLAPRLARLISRAKLCEATASVCRVSSVVVFCPAFRDPRFPRFLVDRERPSSSSLCSPWRSRERSSGSSMRTLPTLGALLKDLLHTSGVRSAAREEGRREGGHEERGWPSVDEAVLRTRLWPL